MNQFQRFSPRWNAGPERGYFGDMPMTFGSPRIGLDPGAAWERASTATWQRPQPQGDLQSLVRMFAESMRNRMPPPEPEPNPAFAGFIDYLFRQSPSLVYQMLGRGPRPGPGYGGMPSPRGAAPTDSY